MTPVADLSLLESLSRETHIPLDSVVALYQREYDQLALGARVTNYLPLLAACRVRHQLLRAASSSAAH